MRRIAHRASVLVVLLIGWVATVATSEEEIVEPAVFGTSAPLDLDRMGAIGTVLINAAAHRHVLDHSEFESALFIHASMASEVVRGEMTCSEAGSCMVPFTIAQSDTPRTVQITAELTILSDDNDPRFPDDAAIEVVVRTVPRSCALDASAGLVNREQGALGADVSLDSEPVSGTLTGLRTRAITLALDDGTPVRFDIGLLDVSRAASALEVELRSVGAGQEIRFPLSNTAIRVLDMEGTFEELQAQLAEVFGEDVELSFYCDYQATTTDPCIDGATFELMARGEELVAGETATDARLWFGGASGGTAAEGCAADRGYRVRVAAWVVML